MTRVAARPPRPPSAPDLAGVAIMAGACLLAGASLVAVAVVATGRVWAAGYVSETGVLGQPGSAAYRAGMLAAALGLVLMGVVLWRAPVTSPPMLAGSLLGVAGGLVGVSGVVACSAGCPLPPYQRALPTDLVHAGASAVAVVALVAAMLVLGTTAMDAGLRRASRVAFATVAPLVVLMGLAMLAVGRGWLTGSLERVTLLAVLTWTLVLAARLVTPLSIPLPKRRS